jgi:hypothetical protein
MNTEGRTPVLGYARYILGYTQNDALTDSPMPQEGKFNINCDSAEKPSPCGSGFRGLSSKALFPKVRL